MKAKRLVLALLAGVAMAMVLFIVLPSTPVDAEFNIDPSPGGGTCTSYQCNYCCEERCGCSAPIEGTYWCGYCTCSSLGCTRVCKICENREP